MLIDVALLELLHPAGVDFDGFRGMSPGNELDKCIGDLRRKVTEAHKYSKV